MIYDEIMTAASCENVEGSEDGSICGGEMSRLVVMRQACSHMPSAVSSLRRRECEEWGAEALEVLPNYAGLRPGSSKARFILANAKLSKRHKKKLVVFSYFERLSLNCAALSIKGQAFASLLRQRVAGPWHLPSTTLRARRLSAYC